MTVERSWEFQTGLYDLVSAALVGEGLSGGDVPVYDRARANPPALFARLDSHNVVDAEVKAGAAAQHGMTVHLFHSDATSRAEIKRLAGVVAAALRDQVVAGGALQIETTAFQVDDDGQAEHAMLRVSAWIMPATA